MSDNPETISEAKAAEEKRERHLRLSRAAFPLAGPDVFLHFTLGSLGQLEEDADKLMPGYDDRGFSPFGVYEKLLLAGHPGAVRAVLDHGLKREDENRKIVPATDIDLDAIDWPVTEVVEPALNVLAYCWFGRTYAEMIAEATAAREAAVEEARKAWKDEKAKSGETA